MSENSDDIDYDGHSIDSRSQIIIQVLRDLGETTAGDLASEAGLDDTSQVHHRVREHLGPDAAELVGSPAPNLDRAARQTRSCTQ